MADEHARGEELQKIVRRLTDDAGRGVARRREHGPAGLRGVVDPLRLQELKLRQALGEGSGRGGAYG